VRSDVRPRPRAGGARGDGVAAHPVAARLRGSAQTRARGPATGDATAPPQAAEPLPRLRQRPFVPTGCAARSPRQGAGGDGTVGAGVRGLLAGKAGPWPRPLTRPRDETEAMLAHAVDHLDDAQHRVSLIASLMARNDPRGQRISAPSAPPPTGASARPSAVDSAPHARGPLRGDALAGAVHRALSERHRRGGAFDETLPAPCACLRRSRQSGSTSVPSRPGCPPRRGAA
jgi:hypothetical protein